jgi:hypothetical protein
VIPTAASEELSPPPETAESRLLPAEEAALPVSADVMATDTDSAAETVGSVAPKSDTGMPASYRESARLLSGAVAAPMMPAAAAAAASESAPNPLTTNGTARPPSACSKRRRD